MNWIGRPLYGSVTFEWPKITTQNNLLTFIVPDSATIMPFAYSWLVLRSVFYSLLLLLAWTDQINHFLRFFSSKRFFKVPKNFISMWKSELFRTIVYIILHYVIFIDFVLGMSFYFSLNYISRHSRSVVPYLVKASLI